ncbi:hypothetical protein [Kitasatospora sp. MAP5-34]|uniref:hypothetical protein n=1 Tax=Kitasatospora sp. MAP5-34 TaxID=3035102 RepID=UPI002475718E|nr:hypothetical protein [Kitasatospora sp. MAP5-34]MDH6576751.1 hypothetical protein [Kitasatospora sp. MAP5-34]
MAASTGGEFLLKPWEVHGEGREFESISNGFARAALALEQGLGGLGTPWGKDDPGAGFGTAYGEAQPELLAGLHALADKLAGIGTGLHMMADQTSGTESDVAASFSAGGTGGGPATV